MPKRRRKNRQSRLLVQASHLAIVAELVFLVDGHGVRLRRDHHHVVTVVVVVIHGTIVDAEGICVRVLITVIRIHERTETLDANAAEDTKDVALVFVKLGRGFAAEGEEVLAEEGLDAGEGEMGETGAVVEECVDALVLLVAVLCLRGMGMGTYT